MLAVTLTLYTVEKFFDTKLLKSFYYTYGSLRGPETHLSPLAGLSRSRRRYGEHEDEGWSLRRGTAAATETAFVEGGDVGGVNH